MATWSEAPIWGYFSTWGANEGSTTISRYYLVPVSTENGYPSRSAYAELTFHRLGKTLVKRNGQWLEVRNKQQSWLDECDVVLRGGYDNEVTLAQKIELEALGYTVETRSVAQVGPDSGYTWGDVALWSGRTSW